MRLPLLALLCALEGTALALIFSFVVSPRDLALHLWQPFALALALGWWLELTSRREFVRSLRASARKTAAAAATSDAATGKLHAA